MWYHIIIFTVRLFYEGEEKLSKTEIVTELQTILNDLKGITADLEQNISGLKDFLEDTENLFPKNLVYP